jgi:hypothetical protein
VSVLGLGAALFLFLRPGSRVGNPAPFPPAGAPHPFASSVTLRIPASTRPPGGRVESLANPPGSLEPPNAPPARGAAPVPNESVPSPEAVIRHVRMVITQYNGLFGENPVGTNEEITRALLGNNPRQVNFLSQETDRLTANGEWLDPWGTPYFFHQRSGQDLEVRSAGPDRIMWTADDLVVR